MKFSVAETLHKIDESCSIKEKNSKTELKCRFKREFLFEMRVTLQAHAE